MKKRALLFSILILAIIDLRAAWIDNLPTTITQPDGNSINCFATGDEFFNWIHDEKGFTIIQASNGYYYYGQKDGELVVPSVFLVNSVDPATVGLTPWIKISKAEYQRRRDAMFSYTKSGSQPPSKAPHNGTLNNIVVYIKFSDDVEFTTTRQVYDDKFNPATGVALKSYFQEVSYNNLTISSTHYPACALTTNLSYQDTHPRNYFQPYNATTNPTGYNGNTERTNREHTLLVNAITWINANSPVSASLNIDADNDNKVDNVCFIVKGNSGGWSELLWAHRWALYSQTVNINGKRVYDYTFQPENQVSVNTLCHEMFHALGSPDLYHYDDGGLNIDPVGSWDLMESGFGHMTAYMKWKYSDNTWITSIPQITTSGTYTLNPLTSSTNNCYKIASPYSTDEYFMVEYRNKSGTFETNIPGSGLIVYRIDTRETGNASGPPDEVYIYRPGGSTTVNGSTGTAHFSSTVGRTAINDATNPSSFLQTGSAGGLNISNVTAAGATISFTVTFPAPCTPPTTQASSFGTSAITSTSMTAGWTRGNGTGGVLVIAKAGSVVDASPLNGVNYSANAAFGSGTQLGSGNFVIYKGSGTSVNFTGLTEGTTYYFAVYEYNAADYCYKSPALTGNAATIGYCSAGATATSYEFISNVSMGSINQASARGTNGYQNFSAQASTTMQIGVNVTATITVTDPYSSDQILIWIDWNHDNDFLDAGENVYASSGSAFTTPHTSTNFSAPAGALLGATRMRIRLHDTGSGPNAAPCGMATWGEVEDYTVNVTPSCIVPSAPIIGNITQPTCILATGSVVLNGLPSTGTWTLTRTPGAVTTTGTGTSSTISGLASGTYSYTVTNAAGCTSVASANIVINTQPVTPSAPLAGNNGPVCQGTILSLTASTIAGVSYSWTGANGFTSTQQNPTVSSSASTTMAGTYSVTATANGCTSLAGTTNVVVNPLPSITPAANPSSICHGSSSSLSASSSITGTTFIWNPGASAGSPVSVTPTTTTVYTVNGTVTATTCSATSTVTVTVLSNPVLSTVANPTSICSGTSSSLSSGGATTYNWMPGNLSGAPISVTPGSTTVYTVTGTTAGCTGSSTVTVTVLSNPVLSPVANPTSICSGTSSSLSSGGATTYNWMPGNISGTPISVAPGTTTVYTVTGTTAGCTGSSAVTVNVNPLPSAAGAITGPSSVCKGQNTVLYSVASIPNATSYVWTLPSGATGTSSTSSISVNFGTTAISGNITARGHNSCGDGIDATLAITLNPVYNFVEYDTIIYGLTLLWQGNNYSTAGTYHANYTSSKGCDSTYTMHLTVNTPVSKSLSLKLYLEGLYSGAGLMNQAQGLSGPQYGSGIADKVSIALHNPSSPYAIVYEATNVDLFTNGTLGINIPGTITGPYYIAIKHRNSIETWSALPFNFTGLGPFSYDFSIAASQAYGNNMKLMQDGNFAFYCGDVDQDNAIGVGDMGQVDNESNAFSAGYLPEDVDGDGAIGIGDMGIIDNNSNAFIAATFPGAK